MLIDNTMTSLDDIIISNDKVILEKHYICLLQVCVVHIDKKYIREQSHIKLMLGGLDDISPMKPQHLFSKQKQKQKKKKKLILNLILILNL